ncbi:MAG: glycosyltransferase [Planctomycetota bacterium]
MNHSTPTQPLALSVVVPTHGRGPKLQNLLRMLSAQTLSPDLFEVVVVDDGTPEPVTIDAAGLPYRVELLRQPQRGPGAARNRGIERCTAPLVLILNDDAVPATNLLERHLAAHASAARRGLGDVAVLGSFRFTEEARKSPFVRLLDETSLLFNHSDLRHDHLHGWDFFWTCNISLARHALLAVGGFDAHHFDAAIVEDVELGYRLGQRGLRVLYREDCVADHDHVFTPREYFTRHARLGFYATRMWAKHQDPMMLWARDDDGVKARFDNAVDTIELTGKQPDELIAALERFDAEYRGRALPQELIDKLVNAIRPISMSRWYRGVHLARFGIDAYALRANGAPADTSVTVIIVSCNALENTQRCLASLAAGRDARYPQRIIVVDNGSTDGSREWLERSPDIELIVNPTNYGAPRARNQALLYARQAGLGDWVAFLDNDIVVPEGWLDRALYHGAVDPSIGAIPLCANRASKFQVVPYSGGDTQAEIDRFAREHYESSPRRGKDTFLFTSLAVLVRREVLDQIGGFDEAFSPWGFEDDDLSTRIKLAGWRNRVARDTFVYHAHYATQEKVQRHNSWMESNWRHFVAKWSPGIETPKLFDFARVTFPTVETVTRAQLVFALPAVDAPPPRWEGDGVAAAPAAVLPTRDLELTPLAAMERPRVVRDVRPEGPPTARTMGGLTRANVVVVGCAESGAATASEMLAEAGWCAGEAADLQAPASAGPARGASEVIGINEALLSTAARDEAPLGRMQHWLVAPTAALRFEVDPMLAERMARIGQRAPYALNDPRFCHTLPAWRSALPGAKYVCVFGDPATTAEGIVASCAADPGTRTLGVDFARALDIWKSAYRSATRELRHAGQWLFLHRDQLTTQEGAAALERFVGAPVARALRANEDARGERRTPVDAEANEIYAELCKLARFGAPATATTPPQRTPAGDGIELSVIVCSRDRRELLARCLKSLEAQTAQGRFEVVVVNDAATDDTAQWLAEWRPTLEHRVVLGRNQGASAARNTGVAAARGGLVLFLDDSAVACGDLVERHLAAHARHARESIVIGACQRTRAALDNALMRALAGVELPLSREHIALGAATDWTRFDARNVSLSRRNLQEIGGFDEQLHPFGCEDLDAGYRLQEAFGAEVIFEPNARVQLSGVVPYAELRQHTRAIAAGWTRLFAKHPAALTHPEWRSHNRDTLAAHEALLIGTLPERGRAEQFTRELAALDLGTLERTGPEGEALAEAICCQLRAYLQGLYPLWFAEGEQAAFRSLAVDGMHQLVVDARRRQVANVA